MNSKKKHISEATSDSSGSRGSYVAPLQPGLRIFKKNILAPFIDELSDYDSPLLQYDSYDGKMDLRRNQIKKIESQAKKVTEYIKKHPNSTFSDEDGNVINQYPKGKNKKGIVPIKESNSSVSAGEYTGPLEIGMKKWESNHLEPFTEFVNTEINHKKIKSTTKNNIKRTVGVWEKNKDGSYKEKKHKVHTINESNDSNKKIIRLTENQLLNIIKEIIKEIKNPI
jgi:hypothetical protein